MLTIYHKKMIKINTNKKEINEVLLKGVERIFPNKEALENVLISARKRLTKQEVQKNLKDYKKQAEKILKFSGKNPVKIMFNSKWNDKLNFPELIELSSYFTVHQMLTRDMFQERIKEKKQIYLHEFLYPLIQAYDSVVMNIEIEVGGKDQ